MVEKPRKIQPHAVLPSALKKYACHTIQFYPHTLTKDEIGILKMYRIMSYLRQDRGMVTHTIHEQMAKSPLTIISMATVVAWFHNEFKVLRNGRVALDNCKRYILRSDTLQRFQLAFNIIFVELEIDRD